MPLDELSIIDRFFRPLAGEGAFGLLDDAGCLAAAPDTDIVVTTDMVAERVHFLPGDPPETVAKKALRVNLSDLAAKGAKPLAYVLSIGIGEHVDEAWLASFRDGLRHDQEEFGVTLLGGDTIDVADGVVVSVTAFGSAPKGKMVHRQGAKPGDILYVSGTLGDAAIGLALLKGEAGPWDRLNEDARRSLIARYRVPEPRTALSEALVAFASAAMDISDGLVGDLDKLLAASGSTASIDAGLAPLSAECAGFLDEDLLKRILTSGDDYEILAAIPPVATAAFVRAASEANIPVVRIGTISGGQGPANVLFEERPLRLESRSYQHGRSGRMR